MGKFQQYKEQFDAENQNKETFKGFLPDHLENSREYKLKDKNGLFSEQYYKWQFLSAIVYSGLISKDYIGTEVNFPKGNKDSANIKIDVAIFDDKNWYEHYHNYHNKKDLISLQWLRDHLLMVVEIKKEQGKDIPNVWEKQLKAYMKESERFFCAGAIYDTERLYLFKKNNGKFIRLNDEYNDKLEKSKTSDLNLHLTDAYINFPDHSQLLIWNKDIQLDRSKRSINDLDTISGIHSQQVNNAMSNILRTLDKQGMVNQKGYDLLIQILTLKIFDEKRNEVIDSKKLEFYLTDEEKEFKKISSDSTQKFLNRIENIKKEAEGKYYRILSEWSFNRKNDGHVKILIEIVKQFQDFSFVLSTKTDLYQLVFYTFASQFSKNENAQFVTPLPVIEFLVDIVNPRSQEKIIDPTVGIADFLSVSYVNSNSKLDDNNIYGFDNDADMVKLATLNMLLNGDGNAKIESHPDLGSIDTKFGHDGTLIRLDTKANKNGNWDERFDEAKLMKYDVVLTNPPFGDDRAFSPKDKYEKEILECYELWNLYEGNKIDLGVVFLENAYRILKENGRFGIVLSNSIASIDSHKIAREWLMKNMRVVAIFDLPANVFAETGVNTSIIVAYKPKREELLKLQEQNYEVFFRDIENVGYEVKTKKRVKVFETSYKINYETFNVEMDKEGRPVVEEDFSKIVQDFREWCLRQEEKVKELFIKER